MGLNYSYVVVVKGGDKQRVLSHIERCDAVKPNFDNCISIDFNLDEAISAFLKQSIRQTGRLGLKNTIFFNKADFRDYFPRENIGSISCIYLNVKENRTSGIIYLIFTAATTSMSVLFQESSSVKDWFIQFGREAGSTAIFLDLEERGHKFIYHKNSEVDILILPDNSEYQADSESIYSEISSKYESIDSE